MNQIDPYEEQLEQIVTKADELTATATREWAKCHGDIINRLVLRLLSQHLPTNFKVAGPGVYIEGIPNEVDGLIVVRGAKPLEDSAIYPRSDVKMALEIKKTGLFGRKEVDKQVEWLQDLATRGIPALYLTVHESKYYRNLMEQKAGPRMDDMFVLSTGYYRTPSQVIPSEWRRFVERVLSVLA